MNTNKTYLKDELLVVVWNVQHGSAVFIRTPNGKVILVDLGKCVHPRNPKKKFSPIDHLQKKYKITSIDLVAVSHPHYDHFEDIFELRKVNVKRFVTPTHIPRKQILSGVRKSALPVFKEYLKHRSKSSVPASKIVLGGISLQFFVSENVGLSNLNNHSLVLTLKYEDKKIVIPGDNESTSFQELMKSRKFNNTVGNSNILIAPHHGRRAGFDPSFVQLVKPELTIISDGKKTETAARKNYSKLSSGVTVLSKVGEPLLRQRKTLVTKQDGAVSIRIGKNSRGKVTTRVKLS